MQILSFFLFLFFLVQKNTLQTQRGTKSFKTRAATQTQGDRSTVRGRLCNSFINSAYNGVKTLPFCEQIEVCIDSRRDFLLSQNSHLLVLVLLFSCYYVSMLLAVVQNNSQPVCRNSSALIQNLHASL